MIGDKIVSQQVISNNSWLTIMPSGGNGEDEWTINNIYYSGAVEFYFTDGYNETKFDSDTGAGARLCYCFNVTNSIYLRIKNVSGGNIKIGFDGVITKNDYVPD